MTTRVFSHQSETPRAAAGKSAARIDARDAVRKRLLQVATAAAMFSALFNPIFTAYLFEEELHRTIAARETQTVLNGHTNFVNGIAFSCDSRYLASVGEDSRSIIWDIPKGRMLQTLDAGGKAKSSVAFSPDGKLLAVGSWSDISLWDVTSWSLLSALPARSGSITALEFTPDSKLIVSGDRSGKVCTWNISEGKLLKSFNAFKINVAGLAIDKSGTIVVAGGYGDSLFAWNIRSGEVVYAVRAHHNGITGLALSPDGRTIATAGIYEYSQPRFWDIYSGNSTGKLDGLNSRGHIAFSRDGRYLFDGGEEGEIDIWDIGTGRMVQSLNCRGWVRSIAVSPDGRKLAVASSKYITMWDIASPAEESDSIILHVRRPSNQLSSLSISLNGSVLAAGRENGQVVLLNLLRSSAFTIMGNVHGAASTVAISPDGKALLCISSTSSVTLWDSASPQMSRLLVGRGDKLPWFPLSSAASFSMDGKLAASIFQSHMVKVWDARSGRLISNLYPTSDSHLLTIAINPSATLIAAGGYHCMINLWNPLSGQSVRTIAHDRTIRILSFSPNGELLACGSSESKPGEKNSITVWNIKNGGEPFSLSGYQKSVISLAFSPDGSSLVGGGEDGSISVWDVQKKELRRNLAGHPDAVRSLAFDPRSNTVFSAGHEGTIKLWNITAGAELATMFFTDDTNWVITTPQGFFDGTSIGMTHVYWTRQGLAVAGDSLFTQFHTSGLVEKLLRTPSR